MGDNDNFDVHFLISKRCELNKVWKYDKFIVLLEYHICHYFYWVHIFSIFQDYHMSTYFRTFKDKLQFLWRAWDLHTVFSLRSCLPCLVYWYDWLSTVFALYTWWLM